MFTCHMFFKYTLLMHDCSSVQIFDVKFIKGIDISIISTIVNILV